MPQQGLPRFTLDNFELKFGEPLIIRDAEGGAAPSGSEFTELEVIEGVHIWARLESPERTFSFALSPVNFVADLLDATQRIGSGDSLGLRLASDQEFVLTAHPLSIGGGSWKVDISGHIQEVQTSQRLLLNLYAAFACMASACAEQGLNLPGQLAKCADYLQQQ